MARWADVAAAVPELAAEAMGFLDAHTHKTLATLRRDGSPRISGVETRVHDGDVYLGMMHRSLKALDLLRDPRFALHSGSEDPPGWPGDATLSGQAEEITDPAHIDAVLGPVGPARPPGPLHLFRLDVREVLTVRLGDPADHLVISSWTPGRGLRVRTRK